MRQLLCILTIGLLSSPCMALNALRGKSFAPESKKKSRKELKIDKKLLVNNYKPSFTNEDMAEIMPSNFIQNNPTRAGLADQSNVSQPMVQMQREDQRMRNEQAISQIVQNTTNKIMNSEIIKDSFLMRTAKKVEKNTKMDVAVKSKSGTNKEIEHKFKFDVQALQGSANFQYSGLINSRIEYQAANSTFTVSLEESLSENSKIALTHLNDREQTRQLVQYQLNW